MLFPKAVYGSLLLVDAGAVSLDSVNEKKWRFSVPPN